MSISIDPETGLQITGGGGEGGGGGGSPSVDLSGVTATAADVLSGKAFVNSSGTLVSGSIPKKAAQIYTPGTADQTIAAGRYLNGAQTIKGDANLKAENIADGVTLFGVAGTHKGGGGSMELYRCASVVQPKVPVGFFANHSKVTEVEPPGGWEGEPSYLYMEDIEYVAYNKNATGAARLWIDKKDIPYINDDWPQLDVLGWDGKRWIMCTIYSITDTPSEANGVANSNCTNPDATMAEIAAATWSWSPMGGDTFSDKVTILEELGAITGWNGYKCDYDAESGEWVQSGTLKTGLECDGFTPRIGKVYSIDTKLQTALFSDPAGVGFYKCIAGASVPSKIIVSGAGNAEFNGEYSRMPDEFGYNITSSNLLGIWYIPGAGSSDHKAVVIKKNNSYSLDICKGYVSNDRFNQQYTPYQTTKKGNSISEILEIASDPNNWRVQTGNNGGVAPAPTVELVQASGTWKGYKLSQNSDGTWSKAAVETDSLAVGGEEPQVGTIYNEDATIAISSALGLE
jgi:hypothetical protein